MDTCNQVLILGNKPRGVLPRAQGFSEWKNEYKFHKRNMPEEIANDTYHTGVGGILKQAILHPSVRVVKYNEENGYEYETYAIFDPVTNTVTSNHFGCPYSAYHHVGSTCKCCGLRD